MPPEKNTAALPLAAVLGVSHRVGWVVDQSTFIAAPQASASSRVISSAA
jgi:hypothetical protein